jgi:choline dehydrogenase-like flavoprotein
VIGVNNLRVVDSSIIPQVPSANLNAISMAIGEKGSNMILEDVRHTSCSSELRSFHGCQVGDAVS